MQGPTVREYLARISSSFFRWWWAALSVALSLVGFFSVPEGGVQIGRVGLLILLLLGSALAFLTASVTYQGWRTVRDLGVSLRAETVQPCRDFGAEHVFLIAGCRPGDTGRLLSLHRRTGSAEVPFALVRVVGQTGAGLFQASAIWMSAGHQRDLAGGKFTASDIVVTGTIDYGVLMEARREWDQRR